MNFGKLVSELYRLARLANDVHTLSSGKPVKIMRRYRNKVLGRKIGRMSKW